MTFKEYYEYMTRTDVVVAMLPYQCNRETMLKGKERKQNTRMLKCHLPSHFDYYFRFFGVLYHQKMYNVYYSLAKYNKGIPNQSFIRDGGRITDNSLWNEDHWKDIQDYDYLIDIDSPDIEHIMEAHAVARDIKAFLDIHLCPYSIRFSGCGFHIIIPSRALPDLPKQPFINGNQMENYLGLIRFFNKRFSDMVDDGIADLRRVTKTPYSLAVYGNILKVCFPFKSDQHFQDFDISMTNLSAWKDLIIRDEYLFNKEGDSRSLMEAVFSKDYVREVIDEL